MIQKTVVLCLFLVSIATCSFAQGGKLIGKLSQEGEPVIGASIYVLNKNIGTVTDHKGEFEILNIPATSFKLKISAIGFKTLVKTIDPSSGGVIDIGTLEMENDELGLEAVVVTGTMKETYVSESPVKVEVVTGAFLERTTMPTNIMEGIQLINGVQEVVACGVCFTNNISINGLPGQYTAVLLDGAPVYGNLASVYGLNGIPRQMIDRFEVIKGPNSTLYGSEAVAGVINIITKNPENQPTYSFDLMATSHLESFGNIAIAPKFKKANGYIGVNYAYINDFDDDNDDGFSDMVNLDRLSVFTKWNFKRKSEKPFSLAAKYYYEDRRNGVEDFLTDRAYRNLRGSSDIYGESIYTKRLELFGSYAFNTSKDVKLNYSFTSHDQNSYYGDALYLAKQHIGFLNLVNSKRIRNHDILMGATLRSQWYDDNSVATATILNGEEINNPERQFIPGLFVQDEILFGRSLKVLAGGRLDHYGKHGPIFSPRLNVKFDLRKGTSLRANFGTGFRVVNLFTEDHAFVTGQRVVEIREELNPERSYNMALNLNHIFTVGETIGSFDLDAFYTYFTNKIIPDYDEPGKIVYANTAGFARTAGIGANWNHSLKNGLRWIVGANIQRAIEVEENEFGVGEQKDIEFSPQWSGNFTLNHTFKKIGLDASYTARVTGPMALPEVYDVDPTGNLASVSRPTESTPWSIHNIQVSRKLKKKDWKLYAGVQNLFNYRQELSPLVGFNDPNSRPGFSEYFDTAYAYSSLHGREIYVGFVINLK